MSEESAPPQDVVEQSKELEEEDEEVPGYKAPEPRALEDIVKGDDEDEALRKYKESLLGGAAARGEKVAPFPEDHRDVIVTKLVLVAEGRDEMAIDLTESLATIKQKKFVIKEGAKFQIRIEFYVQREIVSGLKYVQKTHRLKVRVDKMTHMCGAFGPKMELQSSTTSTESAPSGLAARGTYQISSLFTDDYDKEYLKWDWTLEVKKDWDDSA